MDSQAEFARDERGQRSDIGEQVLRRASEERQKNERLAYQLAQEAKQQWRRSLEGVLAFPTAAALGVASGTLYIGAFIQRGIEIMQQSREAMRASLAEGRGELQRQIEERTGREDAGGRHRAEAQPGEAHA